MKKIRELLLSKILITIREFPVTLATIITITLYLAFMIDDTISSNVVLFGIIFSVETLFVEIYFSKKTLKGVSYILSAIIAFISIKLITTSEQNYLSQNIYRILKGYLWIIFSLSLYKSNKKSEIKFSEYILKVFSNIFNSTIIYIILSIGVTFLSMIFIDLILNGEGFDLIFRIQILLLGLFYIPAILTSITNIKEREVNLFIKGLIKYVMLPLVTTSIAIIYLYIIKILILQQMPSNVIFRILAGIFIVAFPVWSMSENFIEDNKIIEKLNKFLPYSYMPFILLEVYSLSIRILEFGITPIRYSGIFFVLLQIICLILSVIKKKTKLLQIYIYIAILVFIMFITPLNADKISLISQRNILTKYVKEDTNIEELSTQEKEKAKGAYNYIVWTNGKEELPIYIQNNQDILNKLSEEEYFLYNELNDLNTEKYATIGFSIYDGLSDLNIQNYSRLRSVHGESDNTNIIIKDNQLRIISEVDLTNLINELIAKEKTNIKEKYTMEDSIIKIEDSKVLYIEDIEIKYDVSNDSVSHVSIDGYILEK